MFCNEAVQRVEEDEESVFPRWYAVVGAGVGVCVGPGVEKRVCKCPCLREVRAGGQCVGLAVGRRQQDNRRGLRVVSRQVDLHAKRRRRSRQEPEARCRIGGVRCVLDGVQLEQQGAVGDLCADPDILEHRQDQRHVLVREDRVGVERLHGGVEPVQNGLHCLGAAMAAMAAMTGPRRSHWRPNGLPEVLKMGGLETCSRCEAGGPRLRVAALAMAAGAALLPAVKRRGGRG